MFWGRATFCRSAVLNLLLDKKGDGTNTHVLDNFVGSHVAENGNFHRFEDPGVGDACVRLVEGGG